jgi:hypothetical protein
MLGSIYFEKIEIKYNNNNNINTIKEIKSQSIDSNFKNWFLNQGKLIFKNIQYYG